MLFCANESESMAARLDNTCPANASWISKTSMSLRVRPASSSTCGAATKQSKSPELRTNARHRKNRSNGRAWQGRPRITLQKLQLKKGRRRWRLPNICRKHPKTEHAPALSNGPQPKRKNEHHCSREKQSPLGYMHTSGHKRPTQRPTHNPHTLAAPNAGPSRRSSKGSSATKAQLLKLDRGLSPIFRALFPPPKSHKCVCSRAGGGGGVFGDKKAADATTN